MNKKFEGVIRELVKEPKTMILNIIGIRDIVDLTRGSDDIVCNERSYRIANAVIPNTTDYFLIYDENFQLSVGMAEICVQYINEEDVKKLSRYDTWKDMIRENLVKYVSTYEPNALLKRMKRRKITFREVVDYLVDDTGKKDRKITELIKSTMLPIPMYMRKRFQPFNNHAIILTNSGVGKSTAYERVLGIQPSTGVTEAGLVGGCNLSKEVTVGSLNGVGVEVIDEFPERDTSIVNKLLTYTESGETIRKLVSMIVCRGTKSIVMMGNCTNTDEYHLNSELVKLATGRTLERVGRRYCQLLYGRNFDIVSAEDYSPDVIEKLRGIVGSIVNANEKKIIDAMLYCLAWVQQDDKDYENHFRGLGRLTKYDNLRDFFLGCSLHSKRLKFGAVKVAILDNLDMLVLSKGKKKTAILRKILADAKKQYERFKDDNYESFNFIKETRKSQVIGLLRSGKSMSEIQTITGVPDRTFFRYQREVQKDLKNYNKNNNKNNNIKSSDDGW